MADLRQLFSKHGVYWRDRGPNCSRGNIVIQCPFCGSADHSEHLSVSEDGNGFYCFRNPLHQGGVYYLLKVLRLPTDGFKSGFSSFKEAQVVEKNYVAFQYFEEASSSPEAILYLTDRLFESPNEAVKKFKLKIAREGIWAGRLIVPLTIGWTGRAMRSHLDPRYLAHTSEDGFFFYSNRSSSAIVVEGAIDAMRILSVSSQFDVYAKCRSSISPAMMFQLRSNLYMSVYNMPDANVPFLQATQESLTVASYCTRSEVKTPVLPEGKKDFGEMTEKETREWLLSIDNKYQQIAI